VPEAEQDATTDASPSATQDLAYACVQRPARAWSKAILSLAASFFLPGLGHVLAGRRRRGLAWFGASAGLTGMGLVLLAIPSLLPALIVPLALQLVLVVWLWCDALLTGLRSQQRMLPHALLRYVASAAFLALAYYAPPVRLVARWYTGHFVQPYVVSAGSMSPTLQVGDRVFTHRRVPFGRWSVVAYRPPGATAAHISRVIGLPGETVEIIDDTLHINGMIVDLPAGLGPYVSVRHVGLPCTGCEGDPISLGPGEYYLLSDNSRRALDSRYWNEAMPGHQLGALPNSRIIGRVTAIYWPISRWTLFRGDS
jgi:signal peptidase I